MANLTQVLYGNRLYGRVTYEENYDPQTLTASLSDSQSSAESDLFKVQKPLADTQASTEAIAKLVKRALSESGTLTESRVISLLHSFAETQGSSESMILAGGKAIASAITLAEAMTNAIKKVLADTQTTVDAKTTVLMRLFGETQSSSDSASISGRKAVAELIALAESSSKTVKKAFTEITTSTPNLFGRPLFGLHLYSSDMTDSAIYMRERIASQVSKIVAESISVTDSTIEIHQRKGLLDFLIVQEWVQIQLKRANVWSASATNSTIGPSAFTLFGANLFGKKLYAANPIVEWGKQPEDSTDWMVRVADSPTVQTLYARTLFGQSLFSDKPIVVWIKSPARSQNWTNFDGENHQ